MDTVEELKTAIFLPSGKNSQRFIAISIIEWRRRLECVLWRMAVDIANTAILLQLDWLIDNGVY